MKIFFICAAIVLSLSCEGSSQLSALFDAIDPLSVSQNLAFFELYHEEEVGKQALARASSLLKGDSITVSKLCGSINRLQSHSFTEEELVLIEQLASHLPNRKLKGYLVQSAAEVRSLPPDEIDLGKGLLFSQLEDQSDAAIQVRKYSAMLDLMALQILARVSLNSPAEDKINETNRFIFEEMHFRFPPHSVYAEEIDLYTFLPSVMDNHLGVCLGVTALYLAIAQRIDLPLEIITPPGHIYVRYKEGDNITNIETTARGIHTPTEKYLGVNTCSLPLRNLKEVIGMTHFNQAAIYLQSHQYEKAVAAYEKSLTYVEDDALTKELLGYSYLFTGCIEEGKKLLCSVVDYLPPDAIVKRSVAEDYLAGKVDEEGIKAIYMHVDETAESLVKKKDLLEEVLKKYPDFREGIIQLAVTWIQLKRFKEAVQVLDHYHVIDPNNPVVEYYLAQLYGERSDFPRCWMHLKNAENIVQKKNFSPKALSDLRHELLIHCPE